MYRITHTYAALNDEDNTYVSTEIIDVPGWEMIVPTIDDMVRLQTTESPDAATTVSISVTLTQPISM